MRDDLRATTPLTAVKSSIYQRVSTPFAICSVQLQRFMRRMQRRRTA